MTTWETTNTHVGRRVEVHDRLESTNTLALQLSRDPSTAGLAVLAREQTAGRGQYGRQWQAPPGSSVLMSLILFPPPSLARPALLTAWAAVSVCELIGRLSGLPVRIKWPNDVLVLSPDQASAKKICGILIEQRRGANVNDASATVVGIGLNVSQPASHFADAQLPFAGSLLTMTGKVFESESIARQLLTTLDRHYTSMIDGDVATLESSWIRDVGLLGQRVTMELAGGVEEGRLQAMSFAGVELELASGKVLRVAPEEVRHVEKQS